MDRPDPALHPRRRPDLPAAAPRHLLDRGPGPADPRPEERQPAGPGARQARRRGRRGHGRGRGGQGARRRGADLRSRRRHRRRPADQHQARGRALGARPGRDPADPAAQRPAGPDRGAGRRPAEDRPGRDHRGAARRGGVRLRHRTAGGGRVRDDAGVPPGHLPGRGGHAEPRAARPVLRQARVRGELLRVPGRAGPRLPGPAGLPHAGRRGRARRAAGHGRGARSLEGGRARPVAAARRPGPARRARPGAVPPGRTTG